MNNSLDLLRQRQVELTKIIEALDELVQSKSWQTLIELVFNKEEERLERLLLSEAKNNPVDVVKCYLIQGELKPTKRFNDLIGYASLLKKELEGINLKLQ
jgi:hypothetical protein